MKNKLFFGKLIVLIMCFSCKKQADEPVMEEVQKVFENIASCCSPKDSCLIPVTLSNQTGRLYAGITDNNGKLLFNIIIPDKDQRLSVSESVLPIFKYYGNVYSICNMPDKIKTLNKERNVRFDCKFIYLPKWWTGDQIPQSSGYTTILTRIEIID